MNVVCSSACSSTPLVEVPPSSVAGSPQRIAVDNSATFRQLSALFSGALYDKSWGTVVPGLEVVSGFGAAPWSGESRAVLRTESDS